VVLGLISPDNFLGGRRRMNIEAARRSIETTVATPLALGSDDAALKIRSVLAENLAGAVRAEADKRSFALEGAVIFAYGGAGPLHVADIASAIGITVFYMFPESPVFSAAGSSAMDIQHFYESRIQSQHGENSVDDLVVAADKLKSRALRDMRGEGFDPATAKLEFMLESIDGSQVALDSENLKSPLAGPVSGALLRLMATIENTGQVGADNGMTPPASNVCEAEREIGWPGRRLMTGVHSYSEVEKGTIITGPALVETAETSCVIPQHWRAETDSFGALKVWRD
jgi:N-methylhydantoinase A/oxoprolinase/acetone carboxylase beta subunit